MSDLLLPEVLARRLLTKLVEEQAILTRRTEEVQGLISALRNLSPAPDVKAETDALAPDAP